jgi:hypothetical protein
MQQLLSRRWPPTWDEMKNRLNPIREVEVYIYSRK